MQDRDHRWHSGAMPGTAPRISVAIPSFNHGRFLDEAIASVFAQSLPVEVFVADAGSTDNSLDVIARWAPRLAGWVSGPDRGQSAAVNEAIARGNAPYVAWLAADDTYLPDGLARMAAALDAHPDAPMVYARTWITDQAGRKRAPAGLMPVNRFVLSQRCPISQPATLIRRSVWGALGGLDPGLEFALDYDLWWRILLRFGAPLQIADYVATSRAHMDTKTARARARHNAEAVAVVRRHHGSVPIKWRLAWPFSVLARSLYYRIRRGKAAR